MYGQQSYVVVSDKVQSIKNGTQSVRKLLLGKEKKPSSLQRISLPPGAQYTTYDSRGNATIQTVPATGMDLVMAAGIDINPSTGKPNTLDLVSLTDWNGSLGNQPTIPAGSTVVVDVERLYPSPYTPPATQQNPAPQQMILMNLVGSIVNVMRRAETQAPTNSLPPNSQGAYPVTQQVQPTAMPAPQAATAPEWGG